MREVWRSIPEYPDYEASNLGRIRSLDRVVVQQCRWGGLISYKKLGTILKPLKGSHKYHSVMLGKAQKRFYLHRIICSVFHGKASSSKHQVNHINGNPLDNRAKNLEWVTPLENTRHAVSSGLMPLGEQRAHAKLSNKDVLEIKTMLARREPKKPPYLKDIAKLYGVSKKYIEAIAYGRRWKWVTVDEPSNTLQRHPDPTLASRHRKTQHR